MITEMHDEGSFIREILVDKFLYLSQRVYVLPFKTRFRAGEFVVTCCIDMVVSVKNFREEAKTNKNDLSVFSAKL